MSRFTNPVPQFWLDDGTVASSGKMEFYENKDYSTLKDTFADPGLTIKNTNALTLDGQGRMPPCFGLGLYSVKLYAYDDSAVDKKGALQWTRDDVDLTGGGAGAFDDWSPVITYPLGEAVKDDGKYYILYGSPTSKGERPSTTPTEWEEITFLTVYNPNKTYSEDEIVVDGGFIYRSLEDDNEDAPPSVKWANLTFNDSVAGDFTVGGNLTVSGGITSSHAGQALRKTSIDYISNTTLAKDTDLTISGLATGWYFVQGIVVWNSNSGGAANPILITLDNDASTALAKITWTNAPTGAFVTTQSSNISTASFQSASASDCNLTFSGMIRLDTGDSLSLWMSQGSSSATATTVKYGSITAIRVGDGV